MLFRNRYRDLVARQIGMFQKEHGPIVDEARSALHAYNQSSDPDESQQHYARFDDLCEDIEDALEDMGQRFARTMDHERERQKYLREFDRQARRLYGDVIPRLNFGEPTDV